MRLVLPVLSFFALATPASAQTIDAAGAAQLQENLAPWLSKTAFDKGILKLTPDGDSYRLDLDGAALNALIPGKYFTTQSWTVAVRPQADGKWLVEGPPLPDFGVKLNLGGETIATEQSLVGSTMKAVFDPSLLEFSSFDASWESSRFSSRDNLGEMTCAAEKGSLTFAAHRSEKGGVDVASSATRSNMVLKQTIRLPGKPEIPVTLSSPEVVDRINWSNMQNRAIYDLWAFLVANSDGEKLRASQDELKRLLSAALPLMDHADVESAFATPRLTLPWGDATADHLTVGLATDGVAAESVVSLRLKGANLKVESAAFPEWAESLLPTKFDIGLGLADLNLDKPARAAIAGLDLSQKHLLPAPVLADIRKDFQAKPPRVVLSPSIVKTVDASFQVSGSVAFEKGQPHMLMTLEADGYEKFLERLRTSARQERKMTNVLVAMSGIKGFAKTLPDGRLKWDIELKTNGAIIVNGTTVMPGRRS